MLRPSRLVAELEGRNRWVALSGRCLLATCLLGLALGTPRAFADEIATRKALKSQAASLLQGGDFAAYDARATQLRQTRERTPAGIWKLAVFYKGVDLLPAQPGAPGWTRIEQGTAAYLRLHPDSPSAVIAAARVLVARAWAYRGSGDSNGFSAWLERGREVLEAHRDVGAQDPDWFALRLQIMNGQGDDKALLLAQAQKALEHDPSYESTYYVVTNALLPKWGGNATLLQQYLTALLTATSAEQGRQAYARVAFNFARIEPHPIEALRDAGFQWPLVRQSLEEITAAYPDAWNRNAERAMSCLIGTEEDWKSSTQRADLPLVSVEWFDSLGRWPDCAQRQEAAKPASVGSVVGEVTSATPSPYLLTTVSAAVLLALATLYWRRRVPSGADVLAQPGLSDDVDGGTPPRVYRATALWRIGQAAVGGILTVAGVAGVWGFGAVTDGLRDTPAGLTLAFFSALLTTAGIMIVADAWVSQIVLRGSMLEIRELWRTRRVLREDIATRQTVRRPNSPAQLVLTLKDTARRPLRIPLVFSTDTDFLAWFGAIPDVDAVRAAALDAEVRNSPELGATPEERVARFATARQLAARAAFVGPAIYLWSSVYPYPYLLIIGLLIALPWAGVALIARYPGLYQFRDTTEPGKPNLAGAFFTVAFVLALRAGFDVHMLDWRGLVPWIGATAAALAIALIRSSTAGRPPVKTVLLILLVSAAYGFGTATSANAWLDHSVTTTYQPMVLRKHVTSGRNRMYELLVRPWGPRSADEDIRVPESVYRQATVGEPICVTTHAGALGSSWFSVAACEAQRWN